MKKNKKNNRSQKKLRTSNNLVKNNPVNKLNNNVGNNLPNNNPINRLNNNAPNQNPVNRLNSNLPNNNPINRLNNNVGNNLPNRNPVNRLNSNLPNNNPINRLNNNVGNNLPNNNPINRLNNNVGNNLPNRNPVNRLNSNLPNNNPINRMNSNVGNNLPNRNPINRVNGNIPNNNPINRMNSNVGNNLPNRNPVNRVNGNIPNNNPINRVDNITSNEIKKIIKKSNLRNFALVGLGLIVSIGITLGSSLPFIIGNESSLTHYKSTVNKSISFESQPTNIDVNINSKSKSFSVEIKLENIPLDANIKYQWFSNDENSNINGSLIKGANKNVYHVPEQEMKISKKVFYYCEASYEQFKTVSDVASLTVSDLKIGKQPVDVITASLGNVADHSISVDALLDHPNDVNTLNYQWYSAQNNFISNTDKLISGANEAIYKIKPEDVATIGTKYFYCKISYGDGDDLISVVSNISKFVVFEFTSNTSININALSPKQIVKIGTTANLFVDAIVNNPIAGQSLQYQWYVNTTKSTTGATLITGATSREYTIPSSDLHNVGIKYYYCSVSYVPVTNINTDFIDIHAVSELPSITFTKQPISSDNLPGKPLTLNVVAELKDYSSTDGFNLSYQWYKSNDSTNSNGTLLTGETTASYALKPSELEFASIHSFYCVVSYQNIVSTTDVTTIRVTDTTTPEQAIGYWNAITEYSRIKSINSTFSSDYVSELINNEIYRGYNLKLARFIDDYVNIPISNEDDAPQVIRKMVTDKNVPQNFRKNWTLFNIHDKQTEQPAYYSVAMDSPEIKGNFQLYTIDQSDIYYIYMDYTNRGEFTINIDLKQSDDNVKLAAKYYNVKNIWNITRTFDYKQKSTIVFDSSYSLNLSEIIQKYILKIL